MANLVQNLGEFNPTQLFAGTTMPQVVESVLMSKGATYKRGDIVAIVASSGKAVLIDPTKDDGSQIPYGVLADPVDASLDDCPGVVYLTGEFNKAALNPSDKINSLKGQLRNIGIFIKTLV